MVKMNKKGFLRIAEAIVAVLIVLSAVLFVIVKSHGQTESDKLCEETNQLLEELGQNNTIRSDILDGDDSSVKNFLSNRITNPLVDYRVKICGLNDLCSLNEGGLDGLDICAGERLISTSLDRTDFSPKKVKIFLFRLS